MLKINFAVWNMRGTSKNDQRFTAHRKKINKLLEYKINGKEPLDLVFFQEISNPEIVFQKNPPERIFSQPYRTVGPWRSCRENHPEAEGSGRGVVLYQRCGTDFEVIPEDFSDHTNPVGIRYIIKKGEKTCLCFIGFWNIPPRSDKNYRQHLENILAAELPAADIPCIIAGDTNVNLDSENAAEDGEDSKEHCRDRRKQFVEDTLSRYGLTLLNPPGIFTHRQYKKEKKTGKVIQSFFQCDLLMASRGLLNAPGPTGITIRSLDGTPAGLAEEFETWNSDHLPLFFTVSVPDNNPGQ